jgi:hypothetical protein
LTFSSSQIPFSAGLRLLVTADSTAAFRVPEFEEAIISVEHPNWFLTDIASLVDFAAINSISRLVAEQYLLYPCFG